MKFYNAHYIEYTPDRWLSYDDVCLMPLPSDLSSRNDPSINLSTSLTKNLRIKVPIISANMDTVTNAAMVIAMAKRGAYGILHRFYKSDSDFLNDVKQVYETTKAVAFSIGANNQDITKVDDVLNITNGINTIVTVDIAHGHLSKCIEQVKSLRKHFSNKIQIIAGNIVTPNAAVDLIQAGADCLKVGISNGSHCSTRLTTGFGTPQLSAIMSIRRTINALQTNVSLIADGGIRNSGDIVKALAAGADSVMIGSLFSCTDEAPGSLYYKESDNYYECQDNSTLYKETLYKKYRGQSSEDFLKDINKTSVSIEGEHSYFECKGPVTPILENLIAGIKSGMTYAGASSLEELNEKAIFLEISQNAHIEGTPHGKSNN